MVDIIIQRPHVKKNVLMVVIYLYGGFLVGIPLMQVIGFYNWIGLREN